jgi:hypothetical protein
MYSVASGHSPRCQSFYHLSMKQCKDEAKQRDTATALGRDLNAVLSPNGLASASAFLWRLANGVMERYRQGLARR